LDRRVHSLTHSSCFVRPFVDVKSGSFSTCGHEGGGHPPLGQAAPSPPPSPTPGTLPFSRAHNGTLTSWLITSSQRPFCSTYSMKSST